MAQDRSMGVVHLGRSTCPSFPAEATIWSALIPFAWTLASELLSSSSCMTARDTCRAARWSGVSPDAVLRSTSCPVVNKQLQNRDISTRSCAMKR